MIIRPGRYLDTLIEDLVFNSTHYIYYNNPNKLDYCPPYSTDIQFAIKALKQVLRNQDIDVTSVEMLSEQAAHAVCLSILKAKGVSLRFSA